jgi:ABC-type bacteriocin/lantibiotic exporter with double-glycine peptidase domain
MKQIKNIYGEYYRSGLRWLIAFVIVVILHKVVTITSPIILQKLIDSFTLKHSQSDFYHYGTYFIIVNLLFILLLVFRNILDNKIIIDATAQLKLRIMEKIPRLKSLDLDNLSLGYFLQIINDDVDNTASLIINDFTIFISNLFYTVFIVIYLAQTNLLLSLITFAIFPIFVVSSKLLIPKLQLYRSKIIEKEQILSNLVEETYDGASEIKIFKGYSIVSNKGKNVLHDLKTQVMKYVRLDVLYDYFLTTGLLNLGNALVYVVGGYLVLSGDVTIGNITLFTIYFSHLWNSVEFFQMFFKNYKVKLVSVNRINDIMVMEDEFAKQEHSENATQLGSLEQLSLTDVSFFFDKDNCILKDINLVIKRFDKIGILGTNGSGKTTIAKIIVSILEPTAGEIKYNDISYQKLKKEDIREKILLFSAEPIVFGGNLSDNFIDPKVIDDKNFSADLYQHIDFKGKNLSSGEKKYLQLMRGKSKKPEIIVFDEPLNYIDESKKKSFIDYLRYDASNTTVVLISHDVSVLSECDIVYKLENGTLTRLSGL